MDWETRVKVAAGAARGLAYLHEDCNPSFKHFIFCSQILALVVTHCNLPLKSLYNFLI